MSLCLNTANLAAWVQAIGTICAIAAAACISNRQSREARERDHRARVEKQVSQLEMAEFLFSTVSTPLAALLQGHKCSASSFAVAVERVEAIDLEQILKMLRDIPPMSFSDARIFPQLVLASSHLQAFLAEWKTIGWENVAFHGALDQKPELFALLQRCESAFRNGYDLSRSKLEALSKS